MPEDPQNPLDVSGSPVSFQPTFFSGNCLIELLVEPEDRPNFYSVHPKKGTQILLL